MTFTAGGLRRLAVTATLGLVLAVAGCGSDESPPDARPTLTKDGLTVPGTHLELGETAVLPGPRTDSRIKLTVTGILQGTSKDLESTGLADADQKTPFYVSYELEAVGGDVSGMAMHDYLSAWAADQQVGDLVLSSRFPICQEANFPMNAAPGTTIKSCKTYVTDKGAPEVDSIRFDNDDAYDMGDGKAVTWE